ncbi:MAG: cob(I)yrinic acid a,c-diamide adenosyltransferase [Gemmatimonadota bacterium]
MKIYTRTGDRGETGLFGGGRVAKDHPRVEAYGAVDELNAVLGQAISESQVHEVRVRLSLIQHDLFSLGSLLATPPPAEEGAGAQRPRPKSLPEFPVERIEEMEAWMDEADEELPPLRAFILPGGSRGAATIHLARTVCRRAERRVVHLASKEPVEEEVVRYLNRLSDLLFTFARLENHRAGREDVLWEKS